MKPVNMTQKITVLQVLPALESGGVERGTIEVANYLSSLGHRSIVISAGGRLVQKLTAHGSEHVQWPIGKKSLFTLRFVIKLRTFLLNNHVDILHVRSRFPAWICYLAWKSLPIDKRPKLITTIHGKYSINAYSAIMAKGEEVIVISNMIREYALSNYDVAPEKLHLNYRGVDLDENPYGYIPTTDWMENWYRDFPETRSKLIITLPARITRWKGQLDFIELITRLITVEPNVHGVIVGETKQNKTHFLDELKEKVKRRGIENHISFTGYRGDVREVMAMSKIVVSLSKEPEAFGRTTIEALSLGIPVIAYSHGGVKEQLTEVLPEGLIDVGNINQACTLCLDWLASPPVVARSHRFTKKNMLDNTLKVYKTALQK